MVKPKNLISSWSLKLRLHHGHAPSSSLAVTQAAQRPASGGIGHLGALGIGHMGIWAFMGQGSRICIVALREDGRWGSVVFGWHALLPPCVVFVLGFVSLINSLTQAKT